MADLRAALNAAETYRAAAEAALAARLAQAPIDREQRAAHGFAWVATTVAALEAVLNWCESGRDSNPIDQQIATLALPKELASSSAGCRWGRMRFSAPAIWG